MPKIVEMDERVTIFTQTDEDVGPVILINKFNVDPKESDQFLKACAAEPGKFKEHQGSSLHDYTGYRREQYFR